MERRRHQRSKLGETLGYFALHLDRHVLLIPSAASKQHFPNLCRIRSKCLRRPTCRIPRHELLRWWPNVSESASICSTTGRLSALRISPGWPNARRHVSCAASLGRPWRNVHPQSNRKSQRQRIPIDRSGQQDRRMVYPARSECAD